MASRAVETAAYPSYPPGFLSELSDPVLPSGYRFAETRFAKIILAEAFPHIYHSLLAVLSELRIDAGELIIDTENSAAIIARFDAMLGERSLDNQKGSSTADDMNRTRGGHSINLYSADPDQHSYPGIAIEPAWAFKPSSLNRLLTIFARHHIEGELAAAVLLVAGPGLQNIEASSTHNSLNPARASGGWDEIVSLINGGAAGSCPMLIVGFEPERVEG